MSDTRKTLIASVNLAGQYPIYKRDGAKLVRLESRNPDRRYRLNCNVQTGETYHLEYTEEEEAQANSQKAEWEAGAPAREADARRQEQEAQKFEEALQYKDRIVAFLDILGWKQAVLSTSGRDGGIVKVLGKTLAQLQGVVGHFNSLRNLLPENQKWPGDPMMTQFSDCIVLSVENDSHGKEALQNALSIITSNLIQFGFLIRGGVAHGGLFHDGSLTFGPALIEAYELESKVASAPRVILSKDLSSTWGGVDALGGRPWVSSGDGHLFFNFLPPFMGSPLFTDKQLWLNRLMPIRELILRQAADSTCSEEVFSKYRWLASYFDKVCEENPSYGLEPVMRLATQIRIRVGSNV